MALFKCPRCQTTIEAASPAGLVCSNCGFPGADTRMMGAAPAGYAPPPPMAPAATYGQQQQMGVPGEKKASGQAIAALVLGIATFCIPYANIITGILAIVFGVVGMNKAKRDPNVGGYGLAKTGMILGIVALALWVLLFIFFFSLIMAALGSGGFPSPTP